MKLETSKITVKEAKKLLREKKAEFERVVERKNKRARVLDFLRLWIKRLGFVAVIIYVVILITLFVIKKKVGQ